MKAVLNDHIEMRPSAIHGEKPCIAGSRIRVMDIYFWHVEQNKSPQQIVEEFPQLTLADVYAAMTYYWDNQEIMQRQFEREEEFEEEIRQQYPPKLPDAIRRRSDGGDKVSS